MNNTRFKNDERLSKVYEKMNSARFRNYVYDFDSLGTYCDYLDEYEYAIDKRDYTIEEYKEVIDKAIEKLDKANKKIENMFDNGNENRIIDDLLELQKILNINKGE